MKLSKETIEVLKRFSSVNEHLVIEKGNRLRTVSYLKNVLVSGTVKESFPRDVPIRDVKGFVKILNLYKDFDVKFKKDHLIVSSDKGSSRVDYGDPKYIVSPEREIKLPSVDLEFHLPEEVIDDVLKCSKIFYGDDIAIETQKSDNSVYLHLGNKRIKEEFMGFGKHTSKPLKEEKCKSCGHTKWGDGDKKEFIPSKVIHPPNTLSVRLTLGHSTKKGKDLKKITSNNLLFYKIENIKHLKGSSYDVSFSFEGIGQFKDTNSNFTYWVAMEPDCLFNI